MITELYAQEYRAQRALGWMAPTAKWAIDTRRKWVMYGGRLGDGGVFVTNDLRDSLPTPKAEFAMLLVLRWDDTFSFEDLCGDMYNPSCHPGIRLCELERGRDEFRKRVDNEGVYSLDGYYWDSSVHAWIHADGCGGFVGNDWKDGYVIDIMASTIAAFENSLTR